MSSQPRAFFTLDLGSTTTSGALLGYLGGRWRLIAHASAPCHVDVDSMLSGLLTQVGLTDPEMLSQIDAGDNPDISTLVATWPRLEARTTPGRRIAVLAGSRRQRHRLETAALRAGWLVVGGSADEDDAVALSRLILSTETNALLLGADHSPGGDEKRHLPELAALAAAATRLRPDLMVVLAGGAAAYESDFASLGEAPSEPAPASIPAAAYSSATGDGATETTAEKVVETKMPAKRVATVEAGADAAEWTDAPRTPDAPRTQDAAPDHAVAADAAESADATAHDDASADGAVAAGGAEATEATDGPNSEGTAAAAEPTPTATATAPAMPQRAPIPPGFQPAGSHVASTHVLLAPDAEAGDPAGASLQQVLEGLRALPNDSRLGVAKSIASLAYVLDRSIEAVEIGMQGGLISRSEPIGPGHTTIISSYACLAEASLAPANPSEEVIDDLLNWSTIPLDRHRAMDRLNDLRLLPWGEADGDGAVFRLAAAKGAFERLVEARPELAAYPMPELLVAAGGVFAALPPSAVALALADLIRRPGVSQLVLDQARVLGPLGVIEDESERRRLMANLADDILMPLGSLIIPVGVKPGRGAGTLRLKGVSSTSEIELAPGAIQVVDLPPGRAARADIDFRDAVRIDKRSRHFSVDVGGGLSGLLVDLRDIPMRISDRPESRRAALDAWLRSMWPEVDE